MKCDHIQPLFSELLEEQLAGSLEEAVREHLANCSYCQGEFASFEEATRTLRGLSAPPTPRSHVDRILRAVDAASSESPLKTPAVIAAPSRLRRVGGHVFTALCGAAAAILLMVLFREEPARTMPAPGSPSAAQSQVTKFVEVPAKLTVLSGPGSLVRRPGQDEGVDAAPGLVLKPDDVIRVTGKSVFALAIGNGGVIRFEAKEPPPEVVERVVERTQYVRTGPLVSFEVDNEVVDRGLVQVNRSIDTMKSSFRSVAGMARQTYTNLKMLGPPEPHTPQAPFVPRAPAAGSNQPEPTPQAEPAPPVLIRRTAGQLTLQTCGQPVEVIPILIGFLDDEDPDLVEMVQDRLEALRLQLDANPALAGTLELELAEPQENPGALDQFRSLFSGGDLPDPAESSEASRWNRWWQKNAVRILEAGTYGTL
ncbi:MAG: zf-HC2 domain-containing protein [Planctomycetota bacterium]